MSHQESKETAETGNYLSKEELEFLWEYLKQKDPIPKKKGLIKELKTHTEELSKIKKINLEQNENQLIFLIFKTFMEDKMNKIKKIQEELKKVDEQFKISRKKTLTITTESGQKKSMTLSRSVIIADNGKLFALGPGKGPNSTLLGEGTSGRVKIAQILPRFPNDPEAGKLVAAKIQKVDPKTPINENDFRREARFTTLLETNSSGKQLRKIPNQVGVAKGYLFTELGEKSVADKQPESLLNRLELAISIAKDLKTRFHDKNLIHRDIAGRNVLYNSKTNQGKIIDLGLIIDLGRALKRKKEKLEKKGMTLENESQTETISGQLPTGERSQVKIIQGQVFYQSRRFVVESASTNWPPETRSLSEGNWFSKSGDIFGLCTILFNNNQLNLLGVKEIPGTPYAIKMGLIQLALSMGQNDPLRRPTVEKVIERLEKVRKEYVEVLEAKGKLENKQENKQHREQQTEQESTNALVTPHFSKSRTTQIKQAAPKDNKPESPKPA